MGRIAVLAIVLMVTLLLSLTDTLAMAKANTVKPVVGYTIYEPSPDIAYSNRMNIDIGYDITFTDSGVTSLGLSNYFNIDRGANQSFPTHGYVKSVDISKLTNGAHELTIYVDAPYVYNDAIFPNTIKLLSTNFTVLNLTPAPSTNVHTQTPAPTPTPTVPEFNLVTAISLLAVTSVSLVFLKRRELKTV
jgi:hypothetical protein